MEKITGIKSVDFKITALGHGVVNWNGSPKLTIKHNGNDKDITNHNMPKLRGYTNIKEYNDQGSAKIYHHPESVDLSKVKLYISQNCIRHHLFREAHYNLQSPQLKSNAVDLLCSVTGLLRGYVVPKTEIKRTSPLLLTDFTDKLGNGNFEQLGRSGSKQKQENKDGKEISNSLFSKMTFGDTHYEAYGSISLELLQFIPLCADFGRQALIVNNHKEGKEVAERLRAFICSLSGENNKDVSATYHEEYVRRGAIFNEGEAGILLNEAAINILVNQTLAMISDLSIRQGKGYMYVDSVDLDYNDGTGKDMMRIKVNHKKHTEVSPYKETAYAVYYEGRES